MGRGQRRALAEQSARASQVVERPPRWPRRDAPAAAATRSSGSAARRRRGRHRLVRRRGVIGPSSMACRLERRRADLEAQHRGRRGHVERLGPPCHGDRDLGVERVRERGRASPLASLPSTSAQRRAPGRPRCRASPPCATAASTAQTPAAPSGSRTSPASPPTTTGTCRTEPADARTVLGLKGSTVPSQHTTASAPAASATRITAPALPGSRTSTHTTTKVAPGQVVEAWPRACAPRPAPAGG